MTLKKSTASKKHTLKSKILSSQDKRIEKDITTNGPEKQVSATILLSAIIESNQN